MDTNIGIIAIESYIPKTFIDQKELEVFDKVPTGKYTIGLGLKAMSFTSEFEDVNSMSLTVVESLLKNYKIDPNQIGRLEVGTETLVDKSKSTKTVLMDLFSSLGNTDIEGVTSINACYGATNALFNSYNWFFSPSYDGRLAIVVASDIAVYAKGNARVSGGAGAIAILIGPNPILRIEKIRATFMANRHDFYKPDPRSEYPFVNGRTSIESYLTSVIECFKNLKKKNGNLSTNSFDYFCFHTPFVKMVQKAYTSLRAFEEGENNYINPSAEFSRQLIDEYKAKVETSTFACSQIGNIYNGALYAGLMGLLSLKNVPINSSILMFSYGSGSAASMFTLTLVKDISTFQNKLNFMKQITNRVKISPEVYDKILETKEKIYGNKGIQFRIKPEHLRSGSCFLDSIDEQYIRHYKILNSNEISNPQDNINRLSTIKGHLLSEKSQERNPWGGFFTKTIGEKHSLLKHSNPDINIDAFESGGLPISRANLMIENCIGKISLPIGLGLHFQINGKNLTIPMAIEEPSVIAAASSAAKFIAINGNGFKTYSTDNVMIGQIVIYDTDIKTAPFIIEHNTKAIISHGNSMIPSMVSRGGGITKVETSVLSFEKRILVVNIFINVCDSMGANIVNTVSENISEYLQKILPSARIGLKILTNLCHSRRSCSTFSIPVKKMGWKGISGEEVAKKIIEAYEFAELDILRAVTHNKGIMNGIDAVAIALGQDWRAIEAGAHAWTIFNEKKYGPLSKYSIQIDNGETYFVGNLEIPIAVGSKGGVIDTNPIYMENFKLLHYPKARQLAEIIVTVGLAQNFAAIRALAIEGIQAGHMNLHARNIALSVGVPAHLVEEASRSMKLRGKISRESAKAFLAAHDMYGLIHETKESPIEEKSLSTFFIEINIANSPEITFNVAFNSYTLNSIHLSIEKNSEIYKQKQNFQDSIFGNKRYEMICNIFTMFEHLRLPFEGSTAIPSWIDKLKLLMILIDVIAEKMLLLNPDKTVMVMHQVLQEISSNSIFDFKQLFENETDELKYGLNLFCELIRVFIFTLLERVRNKEFVGLLKRELFNIVESMRASHSLFKDSITLKSFSFQDFLFSRKKRLCATMMLLIDSIIYLHSKENNQPTEKIHQILLMGDYYEMIGTFSRDLKKWEYNEHNPEINLYTYWLIQNGKFKDGMKPEIKDQFKLIICELIIKKREKLFTQLDEVLKKHSEDTEKFIYNFYEPIVCSRL